MPASVYLFLFKSDHVIHSVSRMTPVFTLQTYDGVHTALATNIGDPASIHHNRLLMFLSALRCKSSVHYKLYFLTSYLNSVKQRAVLRLTF